MSNTKKQQQQNKNWNVKSLVPSQLLIVQNMFSGTQLILTSFCVIYEVCMISDILHKIREGFQRGENKGYKHTGRLFSLEIVITPEVNDHEILTFKALSVWNVVAPSLCMTSPRASSARFPSSTDESSVSFLI